MWNISHFFDGFPYLRSVWCDVIIVTSCPLGWGIEDITSVLELAVSVTTGSWSGAGFSKDVACTLCDDCSLLNCQCKLYQTVPDVGPTFLTLSTWQICCRTCYLTIHGIMATVHRKHWSAAQGGAFISIMCRRCMYCTWKVNQDLHIVSRWVVDKDCWWAEPVLGPQGFW